MCRYLIFQIKVGILNRFLGTEGVNPANHEMKGYFLDTTAIFRYLNFHKSHT